MTTRKPVTFTGTLLRLLQAGETLLLNAATTAAASLNLPHGSAPTSPENGDLWSTTSGFFGRVNGSTVGPFGSGGGGGSGDVVGPSSATDGDFAQYDGVTGKLIKDGGLALDIDGALAANSDTKIPSQKAVKTYADAGDAATLSAAEAHSDDASNLSSGTVPSARLPEGTSSDIGAVKDDGGVTTSIAGNGTISALAGGTIQGTGALDAQFFGDGSDGDTTISSGVTTLSRDMYYNNLTVSGTASINVAGWKICVADTLDISAAPAGAITRNGTNGGNASVISQGSGGAAISSSGTLGGNAGSANGSNGAAGSTGAGAVAGATAGSNAVGGPSGAGGKGGSVGATAGGGSRAAGSVSGQIDLRRLTTELIQWVSNNVSRISGGTSGPGGSSGAGDGTGTGGPGGGGGSGAGVVFIAARTIARGSNTTAGIIRAKGGNGGNGALGNGGTNRGGGGGGAGGGGGYIYLIYRNLTGSLITGAIDASGGDGGAGGNGTGTGNGGDSGQPGGGGRIDVYNISGGSQPITETTTAGSANAASGGTGGATATATPQQVNL